MKINHVIIGGLIICTILLANTFRSCQDAKELNILNEALDAELITWKDKNGNNLAKIQVLETRNTETFTNLEVSDSLIKELQKEVKSAKGKIKKGGSVTIVEGETVFDTIFVPTNSKIYSNIFNDSITSSINNQWISSDFGFTLDSINSTDYSVGSVIYSLQVQNKYTVTIGKEDGKSFAEVKNLNPYSTTTALRTYQVTLPEPPKLTIGAFIGPGVLLNKEPKLGVVMGVGLNYKL